MSNKRQWYAIRSDLQKRGLWRYAEASATKKVRVGGKKRPAPAEPAPDDPLEGTSSDYQEPPAKQICEYGKSYKIYSYGKWAKYSRGNYTISKGRKIVNSGEVVCRSSYYGPGPTLFDCDIHEI